MKIIRPAIYKRLVIGVPILVLLTTLFGSLQIGIASIYNLTAHAELNRWPTEPERIASKWSIVETNLLVSRKINPDNPSISANIGRLFQYKDLNAALKAYSDASKLRPSDGSNWASIAEIKSRLNQIDANFSRALQNADLWGPWEPAVQYLMVSAGVRAWPQMNADDRLIVQKAAIRSLQSPRNHHITGRMLGQYGFLPLVCPHLPRTGSYSTYCLSNQSAFRP